MAEGKLIRLTEENFARTSLDAFVRHQEVTECWRREEGVWTLKPVRFTEEWGLEKRREVADEILHSVKAGGMAWAVIREDAVKGFVLLDGKRTGSAGQYMELNLLQVSAEERRRGDGRWLFRQACRAAAEAGASALYISAHSSRESVAFYRAMGCVDAQEVNAVRAAEEPWDLQLECPLGSDAEVWS